MKNLFSLSIFLALVFALFSCSAAKQQTSCKHCDITAIPSAASVGDKMALQDLFCSIQADCMKTNVEFSEVANEALFEALDNSPRVFLAVFDEAKADKQQLVLSLLAFPVSDNMNLQALSKKLTLVNDYPAAKARLLAALEAAAEKM